tara:strand:- start:1231 stop:2052 length:822 start_codon:yes stop_codon:yes gene_type:complete
MNNEIVKNETSIPDVLAELQQTENVVKALMASKHYAKMGAEGVYAIVQKAKSMGIPVMEALNGGIYFVQGKTEMSAQMMNRLIRSKGHSIKKDPKSTNHLCVLHGTRSDNKDTWSVSFSIDDAKNAGLYKPNSPWAKYPSVMCFNRALSMLARQLFPDIIIDCYVEGEISKSPGLHEVVVSYVTTEELDKLNEALSHDENPAEATEVIKQRLKINNLEEIKSDRFAAMMAWLSKRISDQMEAEQNKEVVEEPFEEIVVESDPISKDSPSVFDE